MSLLIIGSMAFDSIESPFGKAERIIGGSASYIGYAASYFTKNINLVAVVGNDFPETELSSLQQKGMDIDGVQIKKDEESFFWAGRYHNDMNSRDTLETRLNVLGTFDPIIPDKYQGSEFAMLGNLGPDVQINTINRLKERPKFIALDTMNFWMENTKEDLDKVLGMIDMLIINDEEARQLTGEYSLVKAASAILKMGPKYLIIKKGEHGALLFNDSEVFFAPALPLEEVFDPTGAGDTFAGGFMGYLAKTGDISFNNLKSAVIYGSALASFCVEKFGLERLRDLQPNELNARVQEFINLVQFEISLEIEMS